MPPVVLERLPFGLSRVAKPRSMKTANAALAREKLKKKYDPISAPLLVKTERTFRESKLSKDEDPDCWIANLEDLRIKLEVMGSSMTDEQFKIQILNSLTEEYEFQMLLLE
jgi:gag-polypeptide of LTR copia-type